MFTRDELLDKDKHTVESLKSICFDLKIDGFWNLTNKAAMANAILAAQEKGQVATVRPTVVADVEDPNAPPKFNGVGDIPKREIVATVRTVRYKGSITNPAMRKLVEEDPLTVEEIYIPSDKRTPGAVIAKWNGNMLGYPRGEWYPIPSDALAISFEPTNYTVPKYTEENGISKEIKEDVSRYNFRTRPFKRAVKAA